MLRPVHGPENLGPALSLKFQAFQFGEHLSFNLKHAIIFIFYRKCRKESFAASCDGFLEGYSFKRHPNQGSMRCFNTCNHTCFLKFISPPLSLQKDSINIVQKCFKYQISKFKIFIFGLRLKIFLARQIYRKCLYILHFLLVLFYFGLCFKRFN